MCKDFETTQFRRFISPREKSRPPVSTVVLKARVDSTLKASENEYTKGPTTFVVGWRKYRLLELCNARLTWWKHTHLQLPQICIQPLNSLLPIQSHLKLKPEDSQSAVGQEPKRCFKRWTLIFVMQFMILSINWKSNFRKFFQTDSANISNMSETLPSQMKADTSDPSDRIWIIRIMCKFPFGMRYRFDTYWCSYSDFQLLYEKIDTGSTQYEAGVKARGRDENAIHR